MHSVNWKEEYFRSINNTVIFPITSSMPHKHYFHVTMHFMVSWKTCFWQSFFSQHIYYKHIRCSLSLCIIISAVIWLWHLLPKLTKILGEKKNQNSISQTLFYFQVRKISESKQNSAAKMLRPHSYKFPLLSHNWKVSEILLRLPDFASHLPLSWAQSTWHKQLICTHTHTRTHPLPLLAH